MKLVVIMHGNVLKRLFKPFEIKTSYTLWDFLNERNISFETYMKDGIGSIQCAKSKDGTCANFDCYFNNRMLNKLLVTGEYKKYMKKELW